MAKLSKKELADFFTQRTFTEQLATVKEFKKQQKSQQNEESRSD